MKELNDAQFEIFWTYLCQWKPHIRLGQPEDLRRFLHAVLWMTYSGAMAIGIQCIVTLRTGANKEFGKDS